MTDNEIIKANDILDKFDFFNQRAGRELWNEKTVAVQDEDIRDREKDIKFLKDLINRQKSEIENLEKQMDWLTGYNKNLMDANTALSEEILEAKAEAYKEFAKKLKEEIRLEDDCDYNCRECYYECKDYVIAIDNLLKEMVGE